VLASSSAQLMLRGGCCQLRGRCVAGGRGRSPSKISSAGWEDSSSNTFVSPSKRCCIMTFHSVQRGRGEVGTCVDTRSNDDRYLMEIDSAWGSHWSQEEEGGE